MLECSVSDSGYISYQPNFIDVYQQTKRCMRNKGKKNALGDLQLWNVETWKEFDSLSMEDDPTKNCRNTASVNSIGSAMHIRKTYLLKQSRKLLVKDIVLCMRKV